ncbi:lipid-transfer protein [Pseudomonas laurylsulfatiphila]|uniref:lipid-transfer protein n=1 Tax=Pseudomonas laurylsulfatiphila TaxID=2011015 RepID=UPI002160A336|nr:lipid-transfer protein [Pseudomonas laurylsulfatiphila]UVM07374.1 lipid-transfer protein [Pseudomonas laurylsulfatiphila]
MSEKVLVAGVGMIPFRKPSDSPTYVQMGAEAVRRALADAAIDYSLVQEAYAGYVYGDSTCGQTVLYEVGMTGIPVVNVNNNCSTGSTALYLARKAIESGSADCVLAVGFEQMQAGALKSHWDDRPPTRERFLPILRGLTADMDGMAQAIRTFGGAGREYIHKYGAKMETFAAVRAKASRHAANNPLALFRKVLSVEDVMNDPVILPGVMTRLMACPPTCGGAAAILVSERFAKKHGLRRDVEIVAQAMTTDTPESFNFEKPSMLDWVGTHMTHAAVGQVYEKAGVGPQDIDVCELHDCFAQNEVICYESLGFCPEGGAEKFVMDGDNTYGGQIVINPSGGLLSKGHPLGATGLAQCYELTQQLRGNAEQRQVDGARLAMAHNLGLGGACVVTLYGKVSGGAR